MLLLIDTPFAAAVVLPYYLKFTVSLVNESYLELAHHHPTHTQIKLDRFPSFYLHIPRLSQPIVVHHCADSLTFTVPMRIVVTCA